MKTITISDEKYESLKDQLTEEERYDISSLQDLIGKKFFFRAVTYHLLGRVRKVTGQILELEDATWVAESGRFAQAIAEGKLNEIEPVGVAFLNFATVVDFFPWKHELPKIQK